jgi:hypothetical protein
MFSNILFCTESQVMSDSVRRNLCREISVTNFFGVTNISKTVFQTLLASSQRMLLVSPRCKLRSFRMDVLPCSQLLVCSMFVKLSYEFVRITNTTLNYFSGMIAQELQNGEEIFVNLGLAQDRFDPSSVPIQF